MQKELLDHSTTPDISAEAGPFPAYFRCAALSMVKDEADIIRRNLDWLFHIGVRRFVILDNLSSDATHDEILRFQAERSDADVIALPDPMVAHFQAEKTTTMAHLAKSIWPDIDWLLPVDADEFCIARHGLQALAYIPDEIDARPFLRSFTSSMPGNDHVRKAHSYVCRCEARCSRSLPRSCFVHDLTSGSARAIIGPLLREIAAFSTPADFQYGFFHREFQTRSFAQFLRKVRNGGAAILAARAQGRDVGGDHWMAWHHILCEQGPSGLRRTFNKECFRHPDGDYTIDHFSGAPANSK